MAISTQFLTKGIDLTAVVRFQGSHFNQSVDESEPALAVGAIVNSTDTELDVPEVPNPDLEVAGVTPTWWKRSLWRRAPFSAAGAVRVYFWDENATSDATLLKWQQFDATEALELAQTALATANTALDAANGAALQADAAVEAANEANVTAEGAEATANATAAALAGLGVVPTGACLPFAFGVAFSTSTNQGWLVCDGSPVSRVTFSALFAVIGVVWGPGDGTNTFNVPDFRGRVVGGSGTGAGLTGRSLGLAGIVGTEAHELTLDETPEHEHFIANVDQGPNNDSSPLSDANSLNESKDNQYSLSGSATAPTLGKTSVAGGGDPHNNMQPTAFAVWCIKT